MQKVIVACMSAVICGSIQGIAASCRLRLLFLASRDAFLAALRADQRARSRFTARTVMGATTCNAREAAPATSPLTRSNARSGPKYHMTPRPLSQGHRRAALGKKRKWKSPVRRRRGPRKNPCTQLSAHAKYPWFTRSRWTEECKAATSGRAIETAHDEAPEMKMSSPWLELPPPTGEHRTFTTNPDGLSVCYFTIGRTREASSWPGARTAVMRKRRGGLRLWPIHPTNYCLKQFSRCHFRKCGCGRSDIL